MDVWVVDMGVIPDMDPVGMHGGDRLIMQRMNKGTANFLEGPDMSRQMGKHPTPEGPVLI